MPRKSLNHFQFFICAEKTVVSVQTVFSINQMVSKINRLIFGNLTVDIQFRQVETAPNLSVRVRLHFGKTWFH